MTDQPGSATPPAAPIEVKASASPIITAESFKILFVAAGVGIADRIFRSDITMAAMLGAVSVLAGIAWGLAQRLPTWRALRFLADRAPNNVAIVTHHAWWRIWR